jgi:hypothetical protein
MCYGLVMRAVDDRFCMLVLEGRRKLEDQAGRRRTAQSSALERVGVAGVRSVHVLTNTQFSVFIYKTYGPQVPYAYLACHTALAERWQSVRFGVISAAPGRR